MSKESEPRPETSRIARAVRVRDQLLADCGQRPSERQVRLAQGAGMIAADLSPGDLAAKTALVAVLQALMQTRLDAPSGPHPEPSPEPGPPSGD